jgi:hypothetical protein
MLQVYVPNVSSVSVVHCSKCFVLQVQTTGLGDEGGRAKPRPPTWGGDASCCRRCGEEAQAARRQCVRGPHDSSTEKFDTVQVDRSPKVHVGIEPRAWPSHPNGMAVLLARVKRCWHERRAYLSRRGCPDTGVRPGASFSVLEPNS